MFSACSRPTRRGVECSGRGDTSHAGAARTDDSSSSSSTGRGSFDRGAGGGGAAEEAGCNGEAAGGGERLASHLAYVQIGGQLVFLSVYSRIHVT